MSENRECAQFLGIHVAEWLLSRLFKDVVRMPNNHSGYDFKCANNFLIDAKSSCITKDGRWRFTFNCNIIADFFLCIAFDNRDDLNPQHLWLIPGEVVSCFKMVGITETTLDKWSEYEKPISEAINCCNDIKELI